MKKSLIYNHFKGTVQQCGEAYGECYREEIQLFLSLERPLMLQTAKQIDGIVASVKKKAPNSYNFIKAMARGAKQELNTLLKLSCHEELSHIQWFKECIDRSHCSVVLAPGRKGEALLVQNWDWPRHYSLFSSVNRFDFKDAPRMLCYSYPGLWCAAGVSDSGLALLWTGAGYYPPLNPVEGAPAYPLIFETLCKKTLTLARRYLERVTNSAPYIFFMVDRNGGGFCIEATTKVSETIPLEDQAIIRANHYCCPNIVKRTKQDENKLKVSYKRYDTMISAAIPESNKSTYTLKEVIKILRTKGVLINNPNSSMTIDTIVADPINLTLGLIHGLDGKLKTFSL